MLFKKRESRKELKERLEARLATIEKELVDSNFMLKKYYQWYENEKNKLREESLKMLTDVDRLISENSRMASELVALKTGDKKNAT